jgi:hypothetical protein
MHAGLYAYFACWPACKFNIQPFMQFLHSGQQANPAFNPECNSCIRGILHAIFAVLLSAKISPLLSAESARDSINYFNYLI